MSVLTRAQQLQEQATSNKRSQKLLMFPENLLHEGTANIMRFNINLPSGSKYLGDGKGQYKRAVNKDGSTATSTYRKERAGATVANRFSGNYVRTTTTIDLYMPPQIQTSYSADWGQEELGVLGSATDALNGLT